MNQYRPWLLIIAGVLALAAAVIYWRMSYVVSDWTPGPLDGAKGTIYPNPSLNDNLTEGTHGKNRMEAAWLANRQEGIAQGKSLVQTPISSALVDDGREQVEATRKG
jgi:hypothetical protein